MFCLFYYGILHLRDEELVKPKGELLDESDRGYNSFTHIKKWSQAIIFIVFKAVKVAVSALLGHINLLKVHTSKPQKKILVHCKGSPL